MGIAEAAMIAIAQFDILKRTKDGAYVWLEAALNLEEAKKRMWELSRRDCEDYLVFSQRTQEIVAFLNAPPQCDPSRLN
jgi:hypothetical protein